MSLFGSHLALFFKGILALLLAIIGYALYQFIIFPLWKMRFYKEQGIPTSFYPVYGLNQRGKLHEKQYKDGMAHYRQLAQSNPDTPAEAGNFGSRIAVILYDPKLIKEFYAKQSNYAKIKPSQAMKAIMGETGLLLAEGNTWKNHRKVISSRFHFEFLKENIPLIVSTTREFLGEVSKTSLNKVNILDEAQKITGEVVGRIFFGENLNKFKIRGQIMTLYLAELMARSSTSLRRDFLIFLAFVTGVNLEYVPSYREFLKEVKEFRQFCFNIIKERRDSGVQGTDLLWVLLEQQKTAKPEERFTDEDIINEFITFFIAGMDTTGHLVAMSLYLLNRDPNSLEKLQDEIDRIYNQTDPVTIEALNQMDFMQGVLKEALRLYSPAPIIFPRLAQVDHTIGDLKIKKGSSVRPTSLFNCSNPKYFEEPEKFKPERWLNKKEQDLDSYVYIPFSAGARNCIGQHLALMEAKIIVSEFIKMFKFEMSSKDYELVMGFNFLYGPKNKIEMDLQLK